MLIDDLKEAQIYEKRRDGRRLSKPESELWAELCEAYQLTGDGRARTQLILADALGRARQTIVRWKKEGMPLEGDGSFDPIRVFEWAAAAYPETNAAGGAADQSDRPQWQAHKEKFQALRAELEYNQALGNLVERDAVAHMLSTRAGELAKSLLTFRRRLVPLLVERDEEEIDEILSAEINELLKTYSRPADLADVQP